MLSKNQIRFITSLHQKKFRKEENLFICEGEKVVVDLLSSDLIVKSVFCTNDFLPKLTGEIIIPGHVVLEIVTESELKKISALTTPNQVLAIAEIPVEREINFKSGLKLVPDNINDPGNLGTLIRIADWFGIDEIICSNNTVDCFSPKVVQSAMGSIFRITIHYRELAEIFSKNLAESSLPVYGTVLDGKNIYKEKLSDSGFIVIGNESLGIQIENLKFITHPITIPLHHTSKADSLNVAIAAGIICSEFRR